MINSFYKCSLHRELLDQNIKRYVLSLSGRILDLGSKNRRYDSLFVNADEIVAIDIKPKKGKKVMTADARKLPFKDKSFDTVASFEVLEYIIEINEVISEVARALKDGGAFIFSVPFLDPIHGDIDKVRYTFKAWRELLNNYFTVKEIKVLGGRYSTIWDFFFERVRNHCRKISQFLLFPGLLILKKISMYLDGKEKNRRYPLGYFFICIKK